MPDNVLLRSGPQIRATKEGRIWHPHVKMEFGDNGNSTEVSATNPLPVTGGSSSPSLEVSTANSTATPLNAAAVFLGTWELNTYPDLICTVNTDQSGTLRLEFSSDGVNTDSSVPIAYLANQLNLPQVFVKGGRYFRLRFTNDSASNQTFLRIHISYGTFNKLTSALGGLVPGQAGAVLTRPSNSELDLARGLQQDQTLINKFGHVSNVDIGTAPADVWNAGGDYTGHPTGSPETVEVFSSDAADTSAGTGMRTVRIHGLLTSDDTSETTEDVTLNGTTAVDTANTWYRIYRARGLMYGSGGTNAGSITIRHNVTTANVFASVPVGQGQTTIGAFTIPAGCTGYLESFYGILARSSGAAGSAQMSFRVREFGTGGYNSVRYYGMTTSVEAKPPTPMYGVQFPEKSDIKVRVESVSDNDSEVSVDFNLIIVKN